MRDVFITHTASELPGPPVPSDRIEEYLGEVHPERRRLRDKVLRNNGIETRHYAIDPATKQPTCTTAELQATAVRKLLAEAGLTIDDMDLLAVGTAFPDFVTPGIASAVHGELGGHGIEIVSTSGVCTASMSAFKYGAMAVASGSSQVAVVGAADRPSAHLRAPFFTAELQARAVDENDPHIALQAEFLRWMLSDGAGAALMRNQPREGGLSYKVEWVQMVSFAYELPTCMYMGALRNDDGSLRSYKDAANLGEAVRQGYFNLRQDTKLLRHNIVPVTTTRMLERVQVDQGLTPDQVQWVLPHWSSDLFREPGVAAFYEMGYKVPLEKVRSNLTNRGNIAAASIYVMLDDLHRTGEVKPGDGILLVVPESGRFNTGYALLRAVEA